MITVDEIRRKSERKYDEVLLNSLEERSCFPLEIRSNKVLSKDFAEMSREIAEVIGASKDRMGFGYSVVSETTSTRHHGIQDIPKSIVFRTQKDFLKFINKENEFDQMVRSFNLVKSELPQLHTWLVKNPRLIISHAKNWPDLIKVCKWFIKNFEPHKYYIRELPIPVHTKFIEENKFVLRSLLDVLIPEIADSFEINFERRFGLKYDQPLIRFRSLDDACWKEYRYNDLTVPIDQFSAAQLECKRVIIIENKMNFLTFPSVDRSIAVWGKGFSLEILKEVKWLSNKEIYYWSDLDVQGYQMLSQLRSYFPQTRSFLMEGEVLDAYKEFIVTGTISLIDKLAHLSDEELVVYEYLLKNNLRLEQERIHQKSVIDCVNRLFL